MQIKQNKITIAKLQKHLEEIGDLEILSLTGIRYMLKALMKYTYKRATRLQAVTLSAERIRLFCEVIYIQEFLANERYKLIWVDEFHSNMSHILGYNWSKRGV